jgi:hypothetical protein
MTVESVQANFVNVQSVGVTSMNALKLGVGNPSPNHQPIVDITTTRQYGNVNLNYEESTVKLHGNADEYPRLEIYAHGLNGSLETYESSELVLLKSRGIKTEPTQTISGDTVGTLIGRGWNNSINGYTTVSQITFLQTGNTTPSGTPGALLFGTNDGSQGQFGSVERMRINSVGNVGLSTTNPNHKIEVFNFISAQYSAQFVQTTNDLVHRNVAVNGSYASINTLLDVDRSSTADYFFLMCRSNVAAVADAEFILRGDGNAFADGSWSGGGADYAEYFEWLDGNTNNEDRRGFSVVLEEGKIRPATSEDNLDSIIGVVSANPTIVGDTAWNYWKGKYLRDRFGSYILEDYEVWEWTETITNQSLVPGTQETTEEKLHSYAFDSIPGGVVVPEDKTIKIQQRRKLNSDYNPELEYVPREDRPEWSTIGIMGKLRILKNQPKRNGWIKLRDIDDDVEEWFLR